MRRQSSQQSPTHIPPAFTLHTPLVASAQGRDRFRTVGSSFPAREVAFIYGSCSLVSYGWLPWPVITCPSRTCAATSGDVVAGAQQSYMASPGILSEVYYSFSMPIVSSSMTPPLTGGVIFGLLPSPPSWPLRRPARSCELVTYVTHGSYLLCSNFISCFCSLQIHGGALGRGGESLQRSESVVSSGWWFHGNSQLWLQPLPSSAAAAADCQILER